MNTFSKVLAASFVSVAALSGTAFAENGNSAFAQMVEQNTYTNDGSAASSNGTVGYAYQPGFLAHASKQDAVNIRNVSELPKAEASQLQSQSKASVQALQASVSSDRGLVSALAAQNVSPSQIVGVSHAFDGSTTYIVR